MFERDKRDVREMLKRCKRYVPVWSRKLVWPKSSSIIIANNNELMSITKPMDQFE